ncbi:Cellulase (glycosyl hydrolase family 5) [Lachnospiraceae bacterium]|nr:Cellulase (glycosyl hydrolase family 5) [Lachnospiraceae bacterium]
MTANKRRSKMSKFLIHAVSAVLTLLLMTGAASVKSVYAAPANSREAVERMGLGWNLYGFNWYDRQCFENKRLMNYGALTRRIDTVHSAGFTTIRIPVCWSPHMDASGHLVQDETTALLHSIVQYSTAKGMYVIVGSMNDLGEHASGEYSYGYRNRWDLSDVPTDEFRAQYTNLWTDISRLFADTDYHVVFEPYNEPKNFAVNAQEYGYQGNYNAYDPWYWAGRCGNLKNIMTVNSIFADIMRSSAPNRYYFISSYAGMPASAFADYTNLTWENGEDHNVNGGGGVWFQDKGVDETKAIYGCHIYEYGSTFTSTINTLKTTFAYRNINIPIYVTENGTHTRNFIGGNVDQNYVIPVSFMNNEMRSGLCLWDDTQDMSYMNVSTYEWFNENLISEMVNASR